jgi:hypothetical protein
VANWTRGVFTLAELARLERDLRCLACDGPLEELLRQTGSIRCLDCRELHAPLDPTLVSESRARRLAAWTSPHAWELY